MKNYFSMESHIPFSIETILKSSVTKVDNSEDFNGYSEHKICDEIPGYLYY